MQRLAQQKRKEEEERKKRELEERRLACKYFPTPASMPYDVSSALGVFLWTAWWRDLTRGMFVC